jgi:hypothetical protein
MHDKACLIELKLRGKDYISRVKKFLGNYFPKVKGTESLVPIIKKDGEVILLDKISKGILKI